MFVTNVKSCIYYEMAKLNSKNRKYYAFAKKNSLVELIPDSFHLHACWTNRLESDLSVSELILPNQFSCWSLQVCTNPWYTLYEFKRLKTDVVIRLTKDVTDKNFSGCNRRLLKTLKMPIEYKSPLHLMFFMAVVKPLYIVIGAKSRTFLFKKLTLKRDKIFLLTLQVMCKMCRIPVQASYNPISILYNQDNAK